MQTKRCLRISLLYEPLQSLQSLVRHSVTVSVENFETLNTLDPNIGLQLFIVGDTIRDGCEVTRLAGPFQRLTGLTDSVFLNRNRGSAMWAGCYVRIGSAILPSMRTPLTSKGCLILFFIF